MIFLKWKPQLFIIYFLNKLRTRTLVVLSYLYSVSRYALKFHLYAILNTENIKFVCFAVIIAVITFFSWCQ